VSSMSLQHALFRYGGPMIAGSLLFFSACTGKQEYEVRGRIVGFGDDGRTIIVEHQDVPGLMPAMTMPFQAADPAEVANLELSDAVRFTLALTGDSTWIYGVEELPPDALGPDTATPSANPIGEQPVLVTPGDPAPSFNLIDQDNEPVTLSDYENTAFLLTFIYTRCPLPNACPLLSRNFQVLQPKLNEQFGKRVRLLSVSFDPEYDTPEVLRDYARRHTQNTETWRFATGTMEEITRLGESFGVFTSPGENQTIDHTMATALIGPDGRVRHIWRGTQWTTDEVLEKVHETMQPVL